MQEISNSLKEHNVENVKPDEISDIDKENFFKSVLTDKPYEEKINIFGDQLSIVLRTMSVSENNDVVNQISLDREKGLAENTDAYFITISTYRLALSLVLIEDKPFSEISKESFTTTNDGVSYVRARAAIMQGWPTFKLSAFLDVYNAFEKKVIALTRAVKDQNFWKASA
jgi:hypothetical protein